MRKLLLLSIVFIIAGCSGNAELDTPPGGHITVLREVRSGVCKTEWGYLPGKLRVQEGIGYDRRMAE